MSNTLFTDESIMPFGKYKGKAMVNVPAHYLLWLWENAKLSGTLKTYIQNNLDAIKLEIANSSKKK